MIFLHNDHARGGGMNELIPPKVIIHLDLKKCIMSCLIPSFSDTHCQVLQGSIPVPVNNHSLVEKSYISIPLPNPLDSGLLSPKDLLCCLKRVMLRDLVMKLRQILLRKTTLLLLSRLKLKDGPLDHLKSPEDIPISTLFQ